LPRGRAGRVYDRPAWCPDFDISYLLPELDRLSDKFHLIYYDQRGRGRSADHVKPEDITLESEMADLDEVREHFHLDRVVLLGHSWGTVLALEYALRHSHQFVQLGPRILRS
jgi:proline iminopeptidase